MVTRRWADTCRPRFSFAMTSEVQLFWVPLYCALVPFDFTPPPNRAADTTWFEPPQPRYLQYEVAGFRDLVARTAAASIGARCGCVIRARRLARSETTLPRRRRPRWLAGRDHRPVRDVRR